MRVMAGVSMEKADRARGRRTPAHHPTGGWMRTPLGRKPEVECGNRMEEPARGASLQPSALSPQPSALSPQLLLAVRAVGLLGGGRKVALADLHVHAFAAVHAD